MSHHRWAHSPVWSDSGRAVAYVVNEPPASFIVHVELSSGQEQVLGVAGAINCLPRFDRDDNTLLFCSSQGVRQPFRVFRQLVGAAEPTPLTPQGVDCLCPVLTEGDGRVLCLRADGSNVVWARCGVDGCTDLSQPCGLAARPALIQTWAGITGPLSPDRKNLLFYDSLENRVGIFHVGEKRVIRHRQGSIAACWLTSNAVALATAQDVFLVNTFTGMSPELFNGPWIPCRYVAQSRRLLLLGKHDDRRFAIVEVVFKSR